MPFVYENLKSRLSGGATPYAFTMDLDQSVGLRQADRPGHVAAGEKLEHR